MFIEEPLSVKSHSFRSDMSLAYLIERKPSLTFNSWNNHIVVAAQSPRLLYSATLGIAAMILATPTGLRHCSALKGTQINSR